MRKLKEDSLVAIRCLNTNRLLTPWLDGCLGEVKKSDLVRLEKTVNKTYRGMVQKTIPVRFPIASYFGNIGRYPGWKHESPFGEMKLRSRDFVVTGEIPVSVYQRVPFVSGEEELEGIINRQITEGLFISSHSKKNLLTGAMAAHMKSMPHSYLWKKEASLEGSTENAFMEFRVYPLDVLINPCPSGIKGFVLCVYTRAMPNFFSERMVEDVFIFSSDIDYVNYLDGEEKNRQELPKQYINKAYKYSLSMTECLDKLKRGELQPNKP